MFRLGNGNLRTAVSRALVWQGYSQSAGRWKRGLHGSWHVMVDTGPPREPGDLAPYVGLRHDEVQVVGGRLLDLDTDDGYLVTVGANVGYVLCGEYQSWSAAEDCQAVLDAIESATRRLAEFADLAKLPAAWDIPGTQAPTYYVNLAVVSLLRGDRSGVEYWLRRGEAEDCRVDDAVCEQFRAFAARIRAELDALP